MKASELFEEKAKASPNKGHSHETFQAWKTDKELNPKGHTSFDRYKEQFGLDEYSVHVMNPKTKYSHDGDPLFSHESAGEAHGFAWERHKKTGEDLGIYQIRNNGYGGRYHKQAHDGQPRDKSGRFGARPPKDLDLELMKLIKQRQASNEAMPRNEKNIAITNAITDKIKALKAKGAKMIKGAK